MSTDFLAKMSAIVPRVRNLKSWHRISAGEPQVFTSLSDLSFSYLSNNFAKRHALLEIYPKDFNCSASGLAWDSIQGTVGFFPSLYSIAAILIFKGFKTCCVQLITSQGHLKHIKCLH